MLLRTVAPITFAILGLTGALFLNAAILSQQVNQAQKPTQESTQNNFSALVDTITPTPTAAIKAQPEVVSQPGSVTITDAEINGFVARALPPSTPIKEATVSFQDGKIFITGKLRSPIEGSFTAEAGVSPIVKLTKASLGPLPVPTVFLGFLETTANEAIRQALSSQNIMKIKVLEIKEGRIRFSTELK